MADGPITIGRPRPEPKDDMFLTCGDFINAGLWNHVSCCQTCHRSGDMRDRVGVREYSSTKEKFPHIQFSVCCGFAGQAYTVEEIERVIQLAYQGGDDC